MTPHKRRESISRIFRATVQPIKEFLTTPPRRERSVAAPDAEPSSSGLVSGIYPGLPTPEATPYKRKASTSAPPSPTTTRPPSKRPLLKLPLSLFSSKFHSSAQLPSRPAPPSPQPLALWQTETALDEAADYEYDRVSVQRPCPASRSTGSLASDRGWARASARASDQSDANRVLKIVKELKSETYKIEKVGQGGKYLVQRKLQRPGYKLLFRKLADDDKKFDRKDPDTLVEYVKKELRYDYIPRPCKGERQFMVHMPSHMHEGMAGALNKVIIKWLGQIEDGKHCENDKSLETTQLVAQEMESFLATRVKVNHETRQEPDLSFSYKAGRTAGLVVEVAWSQYKLKLAERADRYIRGTEGRVRTVIGINLNDIYKGGREAWFSVWKARLDGASKVWTREITVDQKMFIDSLGDPVEGCELRLSLKDFVSEEAASEIGEFEDVPINICSKELHRFYTRSLQPQLCAEIDDELELIRDEVKEDLEHISEVEKALQEPEVTTSGKQHAVGLEEVEKVRESLNKAQEHRNKRKANIEDLGEKLERIGDKKSMDVQRAAEMLVEAEKELAGLEKKLLETRAEVERKAPPKPVHVAVERKTRRANETNAAGPSVSQSSRGLPVPSVKSVRKSKPRLSWSRNKES